MKKGTKQGNKMSPVLANVFLHYVLDNWFESYVREKVEGNVRLIRFADDFIILCQEQETTEKIFEALPRRYEKFGLELNKEETNQIQRLSQKMGCIQSATGLKNV